MMELSPDQEETLAAAVDFIEAPFVSRNFRTLHGLAGTGKTFLLARLVARYPGLTLTAFTGKAASVLRKRVNVNVTTLHSAIYNFQGLVDDEFDPEKKNPIFSPKGDPLPGHIILVDEASMIGGRNARDLLDTGARIIASGDPGQLPPVRDSQFFTEADWELTQVHRQAWDSPIIRQAHNVRTNGRYEEDGDAFRVISFAGPEELLGHEIILCWRNKTRKKLNVRKRQLMHLPADRLVAGEPLMCLKNDHRLGVYNGAVYTVSGRGDDGELFLREGERDIVVPRAVIEDFDSAFDVLRYDNDYLPFAPAYASTVHKAQGSEYESVLLFDECTDDWRAFTYTGLTRAVQRCTVVKWR
jgi:exodeoxyribonuclease-5